MTAIDVLVVGGDGAIGAALSRTLLASGASVHAATRRPGLAGPERPLVDLGDAAWPSLKRVTYASAVLAGGATGIAACNADPDGTWRINVDGADRLARMLTGRGTQVILLSTSHVFDGRLRLPLPSDPVSPTDAYGRQRVEAERRILGLAGGAVLRLAKVLTPSLPVLDTWRRELLAGRPIAPFSDRYLAPVSMAQVCEVLDRMRRRRATGIWQLSASRDISYAELALVLVDRLRADRSLVRPALQPESMGEGTAGPRFTAFDLSRLTDELGLPAPDPLEVAAGVVEELVGQPGSIMTELKEDRL